MGENFNANLQKINFSMKSKGKGSAIRLFWYRKKGEFGNFGDELGPYIIERLTRLSVEYVPIPRTGIFLIMVYIKRLLRGRTSIAMLPAVIKSLLLRGNYITSVGSIIGWGSGPRIVWGSGILFYNENVSDGKFLAVRGQYTQRRLRNLGYDVPDVLGDPALLLPLILNPSPEKNYELGIVPHHTQYDHLSELGANTGVSVINLLGDVEAIVEQITSCKCIISSSLHGLIVAHGYGIPALWCEYAEVGWHGSDVKFFDYFSAVGILEYVPKKMPDLKNFELDRVLTQFEESRQVTTISVDLGVLQKKLLDVAPFPVITVKLADRPN